MWQGLERGLTGTERLYTRGMSNKHASKPLVLAMVSRSAPIPYKRIFKDFNRYDRKAKHRKDWE
jgi:hypothetical protein